MYNLYFGNEAFNYIFREPIYHRDMVNGDYCFKYYVESWDINNFNEVFQKLFICYVRTVMCNNGWTVYEVKHAETPDVYNICKKKLRVNQHFFLLKIIIYIRSDVPVLWRWNLFKSCSYCIYRYYILLFLAKISSIIYLFTNYKLILYSEQIEGTIDLQRWMPISYVLFPFSCNFFK